MWCGRFWLRRGLAGNPEVVEAEYFFWCAWIEIRKGSAAAADFQEFGCEGFWIRHSRIPGPAHWLRVRCYWEPYLILVSRTHHCTVTKRVAEVDAFTLIWGPLVMRPKPR
jgi:hypothetical protein